MEGLETCLGPLQQSVLPGEDSFLTGCLDSFVWTLFICLQVSKLIVLDPHKRLSVREALHHPWVLGKAARFSHMDTTQRKLQEFNARRKLKVRTDLGVEH